MSYRIVLVTEGLNGQRGGVQRVSREVFHVLQNDSTPSVVWSSNDCVSEQANKRTGAQANVMTESFGKNYLKMGLRALTATLTDGCEKIICWHLALSPIAAILAMRLHCPFHVFLHGVEAWGDLTVFQKWALSRVSSFTANSQYTLDKFRKIQPEYERVEGNVLRLGLSEEFVSFESGRGTLCCASPTEEYFLTVTRLDEAYKGVKNLIDAFSRIRKEHPEVQLRIVGEGPMKNDLEKYSKSLHLKDAVVFMGGVADEELSKLYQDSLAFVLLSEGEGFGIVYLEAMFHGKPCIATHADAAQELVKNDQTGFIVSPGDIDATVKTMRALVENSELRTKLGEEARRRVLAEFMPEHFQQRLRAWMAI